MTAMREVRVASLSTEVTWHAQSRVAFVRYSLGASLTSADGAFLVDALTGWVGAQAEPFAVLADAPGFAEPTPVTGQRSAASSSNIVTRRSSRSSTWVR
jgi:hypothetical protein